MDKLSAQIEQHLRKINIAYNADHDLGPQAPVTWREYELMQAVAKLAKKVESLEAVLDGTRQFQERQVQKV